MTKKLQNIHFYRLIASFTTILCIFHSGNCLSKTPKPQKNHKKNEIYLDHVQRTKDAGFVAKYKDWSVYKIDKKGYNACYAISIPFLTRGDKIKRAQPYFIINNIVNDADEVMLTSGFMYKDNTDIEVSIGTKKFYLFGYKNLGWSYSKNDDIDLIKEMQQNDEFLVTSYNGENLINIDKYSLIGLRESYFKLKKACKDATNN